MGHFNDDSERRVAGYQPLEIRKHFSLQNEYFLSRKHFYLNMFLCLLVSERCRSETYCNSPGFGVFSVLIKHH
jgi:hypothetical protein